jgi:MFS family permease
VARLLSSANGASSLVQLIVTPLCGRLCDAVGSKPLLIAAGMAKLLPYVCMVVSPSRAAIFIMFTVGEAAWTVYDMAQSALLTNIIDGSEELAIATARVMSLAGLAAVIGHPVGGMATSINLRLPFVIGSACCLATGAFVWLGLTEGSRKRPPPPPELKLKITKTQALPDLSSLGGGLLCSGRVLRLLTFAVLASKIAEAGHLRHIYAVTRFGWTPGQMAMWEAASGMCTTNLCYLFVLIRTNLCQSVQVCCDSQSRAVPQRG